MSGLYIKWHQSRIARNIFWGNSTVHAEAKTTHSFSLGIQQRLQENLFLQALQGINSSSEIAWAMCYRALEGQGVYKEKVHVAALCSLAVGWR